MPSQKTIDNHWVDALRYTSAEFLGMAKVPPPPLTATEVRIRQAELEKKITVHGKSLGVMIDQATIDAMKTMRAVTGVTGMVTGTVTTKTNVGANPFFVTNNIKAEALLAARLRLPFQTNTEEAYWFLPLDYVKIVFDETKAFVMVVANGKASVLEDDAKNFPTDDLVAQFRLLLASQ